MDRRVFMGLSASLPWLGSIPAFAAVPAAREMRADVVVIGGGTGGVSAALAAARAGRTVILTEENDWIGGQLTSQAVPPDEHPWIEQFGATRSYRRFRDGVRDYYRRNYPLTSEARSTPNLNPGNGRVSKLCHEPRVALAVLLDMLALYVSSGRIVLLSPYRAISAATKGDKVEAVTLQRRDTQQQITVQAPYFIDATELGDLLPMTGTEYVIGAESQKQTNEPHAPAEAQPKNQQAFTCCFAIDYFAGEDHTLPKPADYAFWRNYVPKMEPAWTGPLLSWKMSNPITLDERKVSFDPTQAGAGLNLWLYRRIADAAQHVPGTFRSDICLVNWPQNDYWLGNLVDVPAAEFAQHVYRAKQLSLSLLYWMQTEAPGPNGAAGWKGLRLRPDLMGTEDGLAQYPYVREARRIQAMFTVLEQHVGTDARMALTKKKRDEVTAERFADSVGIGSYRIDLHPSTGGNNYIDVSSLPFQIPLGSLIPIRMENLLPACKNLGVTHITNGCYRLHPVEWNIGEAAGALAAFCLEHKMPPKAIHAQAKLLKDFQARLQSQGVELEWPRVTPR